MKKIHLCLTSFLLLSISGKSQVVDENYTENYDAVIERTEWHRSDRFGMFIHWGPYTIPARGEWVKSAEGMTTEEYQPYVDAFSPSNYRPGEWASLAKEAGMKYAVMTAKHHDGFCMFDSEYTDYQISSNQPGKDFVREFVDAFREEGLKVGLYYSLIDWHHEDYPNVGNHPQRDDPNWNGGSRDWDRYLKYMHGQVEELMTKYGKIDVLWLDFSFDEYAGEKWRAKELVEMIRKNQPDIILNNRLESNEGVSGSERTLTGYGDFETPEQGIPESKLADVYGNDIPWETCLTLNNHWGYSSTDDEWKSSELVVQSLVNCVSKNGNLLLNIGPDAQGTLPRETVDVLREVGAWMSENGESIYGCGSSDLPKPEWGYYTQKGATLYAHWMHQAVGPLNVKELGERIETVSILGSGTQAATADKWWGDLGKGNFFINLDEPIHWTYTLPNKLDTVLEIRLKD